MSEFSEKMEADHAEALRVNAEMTANAQTEVQTLRNALAQIQRFADSWAAQFATNGSAVEMCARDNFTTISAIADAALSEKTSAVDAVTLDVIGEVK